MIALAQARHSMRVRTLLMMIAIFVVSSGITGYYVSRHSLHELDEILNANLAQSARSIHALIAGELDHSDPDHLQQMLDRYASLQPDAIDAADNQFGANPEERAEQLEYQRQVYLQLHNLASGQVISSHSNPLPLPDAAVDGYFSVRHGEHNWHFYAIADSDKQMRLLLGQRGDYRDELLAESGESVILPIVVIIPLLALAIWWGINRGLMPLRRLSDEIATRASDNLTPVSARHVSVETQSLVGALNGLLARLDGALHNERRFTADASHELRTPIASLRVQLEVLQGARSSDEQNHAISQIDRATGQMSALVEDLLSLARLDSHSPHFEQVPFDLRRLLAEIIADAALPALDRQIEISLRPDAACPLTSVARLHELIFNNLLSNAIKYTPAGGQIEVGFNCGSDKVRYWIDDSGPGIEPTHLSQITDRFYRVRDGADHAIAGAGLGLSIALRASELLNAELSFENRERGGLRAMLSCPLHDAGTRPA